eukprot:1619774-Rhodomonas_salina.2
MILLPVQNQYQADSPLYARLTRSSAVHWPRVIAWEVHTALSVRNVSRYAYNDRDQSTLQSTRICLRGTECALASSSGVYSKRKRLRLVAHAWYRHTHTRQYQVSYRLTQTSVSPHPHSSTRSGTTRLPRQYQASHTTDKGDNGLDLRQYRASHSRRVGDSGADPETIAERSHAFLRLLVHHTLSQYRTSPSARVGR